MQLKEIFTTHKEKNIAGRYLILEDVLPVLERLNTKDNLQILGVSVQKRNIYSYQIGHGSTKVYLWSQMHGNESTTTKALIDFLQFLNSSDPLAKMWLEKFTFLTIPILNPDGAFAYTRVNANQVDLNRDSQDLTQPESRILRKVFEKFKPDYCFNLHDQRTIFGVEKTKKPATVSFLAPAFNDERDINDNRQKAINVIAAIHKGLKEIIPGQIGRFDDSFNINCIGDTFQYLGVPTILFEAGHFPDDYQREISRELIFYSLLLAFESISENDIVYSDLDEYLNISQNKVIFYDFLYKNVKINYDGNEIITNFAAQYKEELFEKAIHFNAYISEVGELAGFQGHYEFDAQGQMYSDDFKNIPEVGQMANFYLNKSIKFVNGSVKI